LNILDSLLIMCLIIIFFGLLYALYGLSFYSVHTKREGLKWAKMTNTEITQFMNHLKKHYIVMSCVCVWIYCHFLYFLLFSIGLDLALSVIVMLFAFVLFATGVSIGIWNGLFKLWWSHKTLNEQPQGGAGYAHRSLERRHR